MKTLPLALLLLAALFAPGCASRQTLYLQNPTTKQLLGPIHLTPGAALTFPRGTNIVVRPTAEQLDLHATLSQTMIPEVEFRNSYLEEALEFLWSRLPPAANVTCDYDPTGFVNAPKPPPLKPDPFVETTAADKKAHQMAEKRRYMIPAVTFSVRDISFITALEILCHYTGFSFTVEGRAIKIRPKLVEQENG
jgi:hypothetical protein